MFWCEEYPIMMACCNQLICVYLLKITMLSALKYYIWSTEQIWPIQKGPRKVENTVVTAVLRNPFPQKCHHLVVTSTRGFILACRQLNPWCTVHFCRLEENWLLASHSWTGFQFVVYFLQICCLNKTSLAIFPFRRCWEHSYVRAFEAFACEGFSKTWQICGYINHWYFRYLDRKKCPEKLTVLTRKQWKCF